VSLISLSNKNIIKTISKCLKWTNKCLFSSEERLEASIKSFSKQRIKNLGAQYTVPCHINKQIIRQMYQTSYRTYCGYMYKIIKTSFTWTEWNRVVCLPKYRILRIYVFLWHWFRKWHILDYINNGKQKPPVMTHLV
jgi:hypothetical protein